jgi:hypothetical protein
MLASWLKSKATGYKVAALLGQHALAFMTMRKVTQEVDLDFEEQSVDKSIVSELIMNDADSINHTAKFLSEFVDRDTFGLVHDSVSTHEGSCHGGVWSEYGLRR